ELTEARSRARRNAGGRRRGRDARYTKGRGSQTNELVSREKGLHHRDAVHVRAVRGAEIGDAEPMPVVSEPGMSPGDGAIGELQVTRRTLPQQRPLGSPRLNLERASCV